LDLLATSIGSVASFNAEIATGARPTELDIGVDCGKKQSAIFGGKSDLTAGIITAGVTNEIFLSIVKTPFSDYNQLKYSLLTNRLASKLRCEWFECAQPSHLISQFFFIA